MSTYGDLTPGLHFGSDPMIDHSQLGNPSSTGHITQSFCNALQLLVTSARSRKQRNKGPIIGHMPDNRCRLRRMLIWQGQGFETNLKQIEI